MTDIKDFLDLMPSSVTVQGFLSRTQYGVASYASPRSYSARVSYKQRLVRAANGEQAVARGSAWLATSDVVTVQDLVTLPDGTVPILLAVNSEPDETGAALYVRLDFA